jgi:hypothetical protein
MATRTATTAKNLPPVAWRVSTKSDGGSGNCVEAGPVLDGSGRVAVRDTYDRGGPVLVYRSAGWTAFLAAVRSGALARP